MFGSVNALFSGLAFVGVVVAILLQRQELIAQRAELELTRTEVRGQKEQLALQAKTMQAQQFEQTFFENARYATRVSLAPRMQVRFCQAGPTCTNCSRPSPKPRFRPPARPAPKKLRHFAPPVRPPSRRPGPANVPQSCQTLTCSTRSAEGRRVAPVCAGLRPVAPKTPFQGRYVVRSCLRCPLPDRRRRPP